MSQLIYLNVTEKDELKKKLLETVLGSRQSYLYFITTEKDRGRNSCHAVLVDMNKKQKFLEQNATGSLDTIADYGIMLGSSWRHESPQSFKDRITNLRTDLEEKLVCVKLHKDGCEQVYYTLSDVARDSDFIIASSEEEVRRIGKILYSTRDEDPAESLCPILEKVFFGSAEYTSRSFNEIFDSVRKGELQRVTTYLEEGGDVNSADEYGQSLMHHAALSGKVDLVRYLKEKGANVHAEDKLNGRKPVHIAAKEGHPTVISYFLENGAKINECDQINWTPLHYAVWRGDLNTIKCLVERGAVINVKDIFVGKAPIHIAAEHGYVHVMEYLIIEKGANIETEDADGRTPLYYSVLGEQYEMFKFLIENNANINVKNKVTGRNLLHASIYWNNKEIIEYLVKAGFEINKRTKFGWTPLLMAATNYKLGSLTFLADLGADLFAENDDGESALDLSKDHPDMILHIVCRMCRKLQEEGKYIEALDLYTRNIDSIKTLRLDHPEYLEMKSYLGIMLYKMGYFDEAADILSCVLKSVCRMCRKLQEEGKYSEALDISTRNIDSIMTLRLDHPEYLKMKNYFGIILYEMGHFDEAADILSCVLKSVCRMCKKLQEEGKYSEALDLYTQNIYSIKTLRQDHPEYLEMKNDLGIMLYEMGYFDEAADILSCVLKSQELIFGSNHSLPLILMTKRRLALVYDAQLNHKEALAILKQVLGSMKTTLRDDHEDTLNVAFDVADLCLKTGEYDEALEICEHVFEKRNKNFGSDHPKTLQASEEIAVIYVNKGEFQKALRIFKDVLEKRTQKFGSTHRDTLSTSLHVKLTSEKVQKSLQGQGYISQIIDWIKQILF